MVTHELRLCLGLVQVLQREWKGKVRSVEEKKYNQEEGKEDYLLYSITVSTKETNVGE